MGFLIAVGVVSQVLGAINQVVNSIAPVRRGIEYTQNYILPNQIPDPGSLISSFYRHHITREVLDTQMRFLGYDKKAVDMLLSTTKPLLSAYEYITLYRRGVLSWERLNELTSIIGLEEDTLGHLLKATEYYPSPTDVIRFAVREVYNPNITEKYGLKEDIPQDFYNESRNIGMSNDSAEKYWAAHWQLPSPNMAYEMFHRRIIDETELKDLLKALDVMPYWRSKMTELSYNPLTRVDVRRMYGLGVLSIDDVYNSYLDIGYSPDNALKMTEFTTLYEQDETTGISKTSLLKSYKQGVLTIEELANMLTDIGLPPTSVEYNVQQALYEKTLSEADKYSDGLRTAYLDGGLSYEEVRNKLLSQDFPASYVDKVLDDIQLSNSTKIKTPSVETIQSWYAAHIIDEQSFKRYMARKGYTENDIMLYLTEHIIDKGLLKRRFLDDDVYKTWYLTDIISYESLKQIFLDKGYIREEFIILMGELENEYIKSKEESDKNG